MCTRDKATGPKITKKQIHKPKIKRYLSTLPCQNLGVQLLFFFKILHLIYERKNVLGGTILQHIDIMHQSTHLQSSCIQKSCTCVSISPLAIINQSIIHKAVIIYATYRIVKCSVLRSCITYCALLIPDHRNNNSVTNYYFNSLAYSYLNYVARTTLQ